MLGSGFVSVHPNIMQAFEILRFQRALSGRGEGSQMEDTYRRVIAVLDGASIKWTLVGAHAVNTYVRPRATVDIDFVVDAKMFKRLLSALETEFGPLETTDVGAAVRITNLSVDLIRSDNHPLFRIALDSATDAGDARVPPAEVLVALKFLAAVSPWRRLADRQQDAADLINVYQSQGEDFDRDGALELAKTVYPGAEKELAKMLDGIDSGHAVPI
jgi:hypothetical protein